MVVKIRRKEEVDGEKTEIPAYVPEGEMLTRAKREHADTLDEILEKKVSKINNEFDSLPKEIKNNNKKKWNWLGKKFKEILESTEEIKSKDIESHIIWPAMAQFLREELKSGFQDRKRSGEKKDHYRKCFLLATTEGTEGEIPT